MNENNLRYKIIGEHTPCVEIEIDSQKSIIAEAGAMTYFESGISLEVKLSDGSDANQGVMGKLFSAAKRVISNESLFITHFTNNSESSKKVSFSAPFPGQIMALDLNALGGSVFCQKNAFLCGAIGTKLSMAFSKKLGAGFFGGEGFILQKIIGSGVAFIHGGGTIVEKTLNAENSPLYIETGSLVGFSNGITFDVEATTSIKSLLFGGEGLYLTKLSGTGTVWVQSMSFSRFAGVMHNAIRQKYEEYVDKSIKKAK
jgi:uncharacterized protein (TIGR00266 family)